MCEVNGMFQGMSKYLDCECHYKSTDHGASEPEAVDIIPLLDVSSFLTDISGFVREKSWFTQYMNFGYRLSKDSKPVKLKILPKNEAD